MSNSSKVVSTVTSSVGQVQVGGGADNIKPTIVSATYTAQAAAPAAPVLLGLNDLSTGSLTNFALGGTSYDANPAVVFVATAGDVVKVYDGGTLIGSMVAESVVNIWKAPTLSNGLHNLTLTDTNAAGQTSAALKVSFTVDATTLPVAPVITNVVDALGPMAGNVAAGGISTDGHPAINGTGHAGDTISVYDNTTLLGTTVVASNGNWSFQPVTVLSNGAHNVHATETNASGTSAASSAYPFSVTQIMVTGVYSNGALVEQGGTTSGAVTVTGWIADPSLAATGIALYVTGGNQATLSVLTSAVTVTGNTFSAVVTASSGTSSSVFSNGTYHIDAQAFGASGNVGTATDANLGWTFTDNFSVSSVHAVSSTLSAAASVATDAAAQAQPSQQAEPHTVVGAHDTVTGATGSHTVDLSVDPASYFKEATAHIQGGTSGIDTLHLAGDHQVLDLTSLTGQTAAAKISGIEAIDLGGQHNALKLSLTDVLNLGEQNLFQKDGDKQMMVKGTNGDAVDLSNSHVAGLAEGEWQQHGTTQVGGVTYNVYEHSGVHTELLVQHGVQIALHN